MLEPRVVTLRAPYYECSFSTERYLVWKQFPDFLRGSTPPDIFKIRERTFVVWVLSGSSPDYESYSLQSAPPQCPTTHIKVLWVPGVDKDKDSRIVQFDKDVVVNKQLILEFKTKLDECIAQRNNH